MGGTRPGLGFRGQLCGPCHLLHTAPCAVQRILVATLLSRGPQGMLLGKLGSSREHCGRRGCRWMWGQGSSSPTLHHSRHRPSLGPAEGSLRGQQVTWWVGPHSTAGQAAELTHCGRNVPGCTWRRASNRLDPQAGVCPVWVLTSSLYISGDIKCPFSWDKD